MADEEDADHEDQGLEGILGGAAPKKKGNILPLWGNEKSMNLNSMVLTNIQQSPYYKVQLSEFKTYHEVVDQIYYHVNHLEPWEKGSRRTSGQIGMCGGVRGVGAGGIVSSAFCLLYKLFTLKLTRKQLTALMTHEDSSYLRGIGFMYVRFCQPPADLWEWFEPYLDDAEEIDPKAGGGDPMTIGQMVRHMLTRLDWYGTLFPRIPVPVQKQIDQKLAERRQKLIQKFQEDRDARRTSAEQNITTQRGSIGNDRRRRSPSPVAERNIPRRRSPSPRRSPRRGPTHRPLRRPPSPFRRRSPLPVRRRRTPSPRDRRKSPDRKRPESAREATKRNDSPPRKTKRHDSPRPQKMEPSPKRRRSPSPATKRKRSLSPMRPKKSSSPEPRARQRSPIRLVVDPRKTSPNWLRRVSPIHPSRLRTDMSGNGDDLAELIEMEKARQKKASKERSKVGEEKQMPYTDPNAPGPSSLTAPNEIEASTEKEKSDPHRKHKHKKHKHHKREKEERRMDNEDVSKNGN